MKNPEDRVPSGGKAISARHNAALIRTFLGRPCMQSDCTNVPDSRKTEREKERECQETSERTMQGFMVESASALLTGSLKRPRFFSAVPAMQTDESPWTDEKLRAIQPRSKQEWQQRRSCELFFFPSVSAKRKKLAILSNLIASHRSLLSDFSFTDFEAMHMVEACLVCSRS